MVRVVFFIVSEKLLISEMVQTGCSRIICVKAEISKYCEELEKLRPNIIVAMFLAMTRLLYRERRNRKGGQARYRPIIP